MESHVSHGGVMSCVNESWFIWMSRVSYEQVMFHMSESYLTFVFTCAGVWMCVHMCLSVFMCVVFVYRRVCWLGVATSWFRCTSDPNSFSHPDMRTYVRAYTHTLGVATSWFRCASDPTSFHIQHTNIRTYVHTYIGCGIKLIVWHQVNFDALRAIISPDIQIYVRTRVHTYIWYGNKCISTCSGPWFLPLAALWMVQVCVCVCVLNMYDGGREGKWEGDKYL